MAVIITREDIQNARSYMPLLMKTQLARQIAVWCTDEAEGSGDEGEVPFYTENRAKRQLFLYGLLARWYLKRDFECGSAQITKDGETEDLEVDYYMTVDAYDEWAGSHVMNQLERLKRDKEIADKVFDILQDFKALEALIYGAVRDELEVRNDIIRRFGKSVAASITPGEVQSLMDQIKAIQEEQAEIYGAEGEKEAGNGG